MPLTAPVLDTRTYDDLKREALKRMRQYVPEWTDHNNSDPGMAMVHLFAHLTEILLFEMNRLPDLNYIKFLQLLNMELKPHQPARVDLIFTPDGATKFVKLAEGTRVEGDSDDGSVIFELETDLDVTATPLRFVQVFDGGSFEDYTSHNETLNTPFPPLGVSPQAGSALYLGFAVPDGDVDVANIFPSKVNLRVFLAAEEETEETDPIGVEPPIPVRLVWEYLPKNTTRWRPFVHTDKTAAFTRNGYMYLRFPQDIAVSKQGKLTKDDEACYWVRCRLDSAAYPEGQVPLVDMLRVNTVKAVSLATVRDELVGVSTGNPEQVFQLLNRPVEADSLVLLVQQVASTDDEQIMPPSVLLAADAEAKSNTAPDDESIPWEAVEDFIKSDQGSHHFVLKAATGEIKFGDGIRGQVPLAGYEIIARQYRYGGGFAANLPAGAITSLFSNAPGANTVQVSNVLPALGGKDEQSLDDLRVRAPSQLRAGDRAVTAEDYESLAKEIPGVANVTAVSNWKPGITCYTRNDDYRLIPGIFVPGAVTVFVVATALDPLRDKPPEPSAELREVVGNYLYDRRPITTELYIAKPDFVIVTVEAEVEIDPDASPDGVQDKILEALDEFLDARNPERHFGQKMYASSIVRVILNVANVRAITRISVLWNGEPREDLELAPNQIVHGQAHRIDCKPASRFRV